MANWQVAFDWMMDNEDAARACATVRDACPEGITGPCFAISGINSGAWPDQYTAIAALDDPDDREILVKEFYEDHFWNPWYSQLTSDDVAKRVFDAAVNMGEETAVKLLQQAVNSFHVGNPLTVDGGWGPNTLTAVNAVNPATLVAAFKNARCAHYEAIVAANPAKAKFLNQWIARAEK